MDENTPDGTPDGLSRRDMLRRSALVGGAVVWMAPAVQTLAAPAFAAGSTTGGGACVYYSVKIDPADNTAGYVCDDSSASGNFDCISGTTNFSTAVAGGCQFIRGVTFNTDGTWQVNLDGRAEQITGFSKCGSTGCQAAQVTDNTAPTQDVLVFGACASGPSGTQAISNVQILFCIRA